MWHAQRGREAMCQFSPISGYTHTTQPATAGYWMIELLYKTLHSGGSNFKVAYVSSDRCWNERAWVSRTSSTPNINPKFVQMCTWKSEYWEMGLSRRVTCASCILHRWRLLAHCWPWPEFVNDVVKWAFIWMLIDEERIATTLNKSDKHSLIM